MSLFYRRPPRVLGVAMFVIAMAALSGCATHDTTTDTEVCEPASPEFTEAGAAGVFAVEVGDCFDHQPATTSSDVPVVLFAQSHTNEISYARGMPDGEFDDAAIAASSPTGCCRRSSVEPPTRRRSMSGTVFPLQRRGNPLTTKSSAPSLIPEGPCQVP